MTQRSVAIKTEDGICPAVLSVPDAEGPWPAIVMYSDAAGAARDAYRQMAKRLSDLGYVVLVPDFYYRHGPYKPLKDSGRDRIVGMMNTYTPDMTVRDASSFVDYLDSLPEKKPGGIGTTGYCMGGRLSLIVAGNLGDRVAAAASFFGGMLADASNPDSPHFKAGKMKCHVYVGCAIEDPRLPEEQKELLERCLTESGVPHLIETYQAYHGFAVLDGSVYDEAAAELHWTATEKFFGSVLGS